MGDRLTQELYEKCSTEEERESINKHLADASDWLYDQEEDTKKEVCAVSMSPAKNGQHIGIMTPSALSGHHTFGFRSIFYEGMYLFYSKFTEDKAS